MITDRFVVLRHEMPADGDRASHWDLLLAWGDHLRSWALESAPIHGQATTALPLPDHRLEYLQYEGPVSGNRGHVTRTDQGTYELLHDSADRVEFRLLGRHFVGNVRLTADGDRWRCEFCRP